MQALKSDYAEFGPDLYTIAPAKTVVELDRINRWTVYHRLQALGLACDCGCDRPLSVAIDTPAAALQVWSVVQATTQSKLSLTDHLERCWQQRSLR
ncbi:Asr1405/Asl0597 family protein [Leptolyngbya sp. KIOST-1]|uniref:Asr1405/Asl0597 family protein n=1 Tax=Leptolyngbya sp. KIOST-1 TaxID=1229172 RepID=UPI0006892CC7|nr:Asr1405/Asl0597 family protein [Leptolyngbya sp. KIOST-1]